MKQSSIVTSVMSRVRFPKGKLERFFNGLTKAPFKFKNYACKDFEDIHCFSVTTPARGVVQIVFTNKRTGKVVCAEIPVATNFLITGTGTGDRGYQITFAASLS